MDNKAKPTAGKSSRKAMSSRGRGTEGKAGGAGGLGAKAGSNGPGTRPTPGQRKNVAEDLTQQETAPKTPISEYRAGAFKSTASNALPKAAASSSSLEQPNVGSSSKPKLDAASTGVAVVNLKGGSSKPKPKGNVASPKPDAGASRGRATAVRPKPTKAGGIDPDPEQLGSPTSSPRPVVAKSAVPNSKPEPVGPPQGTVNLTSGAASPNSPVASAKDRGVVSPSKGVASPRKGVPSPSKGVARPKTTGPSSAVIGGTSPRTAGSLPNSEKRGMSKAHGRAAISAAADGVEGGKNDEEEAASKRHHGRRTSRIVAALAKFRKSLKPEKEGTGGSKRSSETTLSSKDQMSLFMVLTVTVFLVVFVAILIFFFFVGGPGIPETIACITDECSDAKEYLDNLLNYTRDPCTDFYGHVCGLWQRKGGSFYGDARLDALFRLNATLFQMRHIKRAEDVRHGMHLLRPIYSACYKFMSEPVILEDALSDALKYLDIAQLMKAAQFFDVVRYLVRQSMQAWLNLTNADAHIQLLADMDAKVGKIFSLRKSAEQLLPLRDVVTDMVTGVSVEEWATSVRDSQRNKIVFAPTDNIRTHGLNVYKPAMQVVVKHGLRNATFYLATILEADVVYVLSKHSKISNDDASKGFYCLRFTHKCLALTWAYLAARLLAPAGSTGVIYNIHKFAKEIIEETNQVFSWMNHTTAVKARELVSNTSLDVVAREAFKISRVNYEGPSPGLDESDPFLKTLVVALRHHYTVMAANPPTRLELALSDFEFKNSLTYVRDKKSILVPTLYQNNPYMYPFRVPDFFNYGTLAALIAQVLVTEVVGSLQSAWDSQTRVKHAEVLSCLAERRRSMGFGELNSDGDERQNALLLSLTMSLRVAYYALMKAFRLQAKTDKVFGDYWPAAEQVFFDRYCLLWCNAAQDANPLTPREKCMLPLYNMEEFVDHYGCKDRANFTTAPFCKV
ncbi:uncharacterized protein [Dermacentor albipictus]|uniref:uncharacterized protein isoform X2 n=1 Tax=Dermacentor albipictus TaxID=60249 RepID=UPI0031FC2906